MHGSPVGSDRVLHGACILGELASAKDADVLDALDWPAVHVCAELLVPEHSEALLEGQLEPVPAGNTVAGPVVEVLVADDALDTSVVAICGRLWRGKH